MNLAQRAVLSLGAVAWIVLCQKTPADTGPNPYLAIVDRNPFGIKPAPLVAPAEAPPPPVIPLAKVILTGITSILGPPRALFEITEQEAGKAPTVSKRVLREGEKDGSIEVLTIDVANNKVRIKNGTTETNVTFEIAKATTPSGAGAAPALVPPPATAIQAPSSAAAASPMIISPQGSDTPMRANSSVSFAGGSQPFPSGAAQGPSAFGGLPPTSYAANSSGGGGNRFAPVATYGAPDPNRPSTIRPVRTDPSQATQPSAMDTYIGMKLLGDYGSKEAERRGFPPLILPPNPLSQPGQ
jgi:hypothetical protein